MAANTPNIKDTPTQPLFQALYITLMSYPGVPGSPFFDKANVSKFLKRFENMCDKHQMSTSEKIRRLPWYCEIFTARHVKLVISFSGSDWYNIVTNLKKEYKDQNLTQQVLSYTYLETFKDKPRTDNSEVL